MFEFEQSSARRRVQRGQPPRAEVTPTAGVVALYPDASKARAAAHMLGFQMSMSIRAAARLWGTNRQWCRRFLLVAASLAMKIQRDALWRLLRAVQDLCRAGCRPVAFIYMRAYDETPRVCRNQSMLDSGETEEIQETAKLMSGRMEFAIVLQHSSSDTRVADRLSHAFSLADSCGSDSDKPSEAPTTHIIRGTLATPLASLANQTGPVVTQCIDTGFEIPRECERIVASTFPFTAQLRCTDMHRSYPCAERGARALRNRRLATYEEVVSKHSSVDFRCSMHRVRTAEKCVEDLDTPVESFMMNFTLSVRETNHLRTFRRQVERWSINRRVLVWKRGTPPAEVRAWRKAIEPLLFVGPQTEAVMRRKLFWHEILTGDPRRRGVIEHYCVGETCCPGGRSALEKKN